MFYIFTQIWFPWFLILPQFIKGLMTLNWLAQGHDHRAVISILDIMSGYSLMTSWSWKRAFPDLHSWTKHRKLLMQSLLKVSSYRHIIKLAYVKHPYPYITQRIDIITTSFWYISRTILYINMINSTKTYISTPCQLHQRCMWRNHARRGELHAQFLKIASHGLLTIF